MSAATAELGRRRSGRGLRAVVGIGLAVVAAVVVALVVVSGDGGDDVEQSDTPELTTAPVEQRTLAEYLEIEGRLDYGASVTLTAQSSGILMGLASEGTVVEQGEQIYLIVDEPTAADTAAVLARLVSARNSLLAAEEEVSEARAGPSESAVAAARASLSSAREARERLAETPTAAEMDAARVAVSTAEEALDLLERPSEVSLASARSRLATAEEALEDLSSGPSRAEMDAASASVLAAEEALADLLAEPTPEELAVLELSVVSAEAALASAEADVAALDDVHIQRVVMYGETLAHPDMMLGLEGDDIAQLEQSLTELGYGGEEDFTVDGVFDEATATAVRSWQADTAAVLARLVSARNSLLAAEEEVSEARSGPSRAEVDAARASALAAEEALEDLSSGPSRAEVDAARVAVSTAEEALDLLEYPSEVSLASARSRLATTEEALEDLSSGPSRAEVDAASASVLAAEEALADLLAEPNPEELAVLELSVVSAEAALASAEADEAALDDVHIRRVVMYGETPVHRTMMLGLEGDDIAQLEQSLTELGYGGEEDFTADGVFDEATAAAVRSWQEGTGRRVDGTVGVDDVVFAAGPVQVDAWAAGIEVGRELTAGTMLAGMSMIRAPVDGESGGMSTTQRVTAELPLSDRDLVSEGIAVNVELPDGLDVPATVTSVNPSPVVNSQTGENAVEVTIRLQEPAATVWIGASVDVEITATLVEDALVVPATALLALVEGGYAVEVLRDDGSTRLVGVETGLFADGDVEVVGERLDVGMRVVVPR